VACSLSYGPYLKGDFVFDDSVAIVRNKDVTSTESVWAHDFWGARLNDTASHKSYRPLTTLMFRLESRYFGLNPTQMKCMNFGLHLAITLLLLPLQAALKFKDQRLRFYTALLFAVHPVHVEAVSGIVSRAELMVGLLFVLGLMVYISNCNSAVTLPLVAMIKSVAILFKETGIVILVSYKIGLCVPEFNFLSLFQPTCILLDLVQNNEFRTSKQRRNLKISKRTVIRSSISLVITLLHVYVRLNIINFTSPTFKLQDNPGAMHSSFVVRALTQQYLYALNFWLCLCPQWLSFDWAIGSIPLVLGFSDYRIIFVLAFHLTMTLLVWKWRRNLLMALSCLVIPFLPASGIVKLGFVIAERVLYIPSIGFCMLVSIGLHNLTRKYRKFRKVSDGKYCYLCN
jgi:protein O-mannosyl-transferase